jgi:mutator protein MutT
MKKEIIQINFRIATKAFIVNKNKLLIIKREPKDVQKPNIWEIPGGRIDLGEDPYLGLMREIKEETGLYIQPICPLSVRHFERDDGQIITILVFFCELTGGQLKLSEEHSESEWIELDKCKEKLTDFFHKEVNLFERLNFQKLSFY